MPKARRPVLNKQEARRLYFEACDEWKVSRRKLPKHFLKQLTQDIKSAIIRRAASGD